MVCRAKQYYYNDVALRELVLTQILHLNYKRKMEQTIRNLFVGNGSMESDDQRASRHRLLHAPRTGRA